MLKSRNKNVYRISLVVFAAIACIGNDALSQFGSDSHTITVVVQQITRVQASVGFLTMQVTSANGVAGQDLLTVTNQSSTFFWGTNVSTMKATVRTNLLVQVYTLKVKATNATVGTPSPEVTLTTTSTDFLRDIGRTSGTCTIFYTGVASAQNPSGSDAHTITFTITAQ